MPHFVPPDCQQLLRGMIEVNPEKRMTVSYFFMLYLILQYTTIRTTINIILLLLGRHSHIQFQFNISGCHTKAVQTSTPRINFV